jgi:hypothetical protein
VSRNYKLVSIINLHRAKRHIRRKQTDATQSNLVPFSPSQSEPHLHLSALSHRLFSMYLWVFLYSCVPAASTSATVGFSFPSQPVYMSAPPSTPCFNFFPYVSLLCQFFFYGIAILFFSGEYQEPSQNSSFKLSKRAFYSHVCPQVLASERGTVLTHDLYIMVLVFVLYILDQIF